MVNYIVTTLNFLHFKLKAIGSENEGLKDTEHDKTEQLNCEIKTVTPLFHWSLETSKTWKYFMTNSSGSSQCDLELAIPDKFLDMETHPSYQAIGSERQIFSMYE